MATLSTIDGHPNRSVSRAGLAAALGWPLARLAAALSALDDRLAGRGVRDAARRRQRTAHRHRPRRHGSGYLELTDDVRYALIPDSS